MTNSTETTMTAETLKAAHRTTMDNNPTRKTTNASTVYTTIKAARKVNKAAKIAPKMTKEQRMQINKERQADRLAKIQARLDRQDARESEFEARERMKTIEYNRRLADSTNNKIKKIEQRLEKRSDLIVKLTTDIIRRQNTYKEKAKITETQIQSWKNEKQAKHSRQELITMYTAKIESETARIEKIKNNISNLQAKIEKLQTAGPEKEKINASKRIETRKKYLEGLASGIDSRINYREQLVTRQTEDLQKIEDAKAMMQRMGLNQINS